MYWHPGSECTSSPAAQTATKRYELQRIDFFRSSQAQQPLRSLFSRQHIRTKRDRPGSPSPVRTRPRTRRRPLGKPSRRLCRRGQVPLQHPIPTGEPQFLPIVLRTSARRFRSHQPGPGQRHCRGANFVAVPAHYHLGKSFCLESGVHDSRSRPIRPVLECVFKRSRCWHRSWTTALVIVISSSSCWAGAHSGTLRVFGTTATFPTGRPSGNTASG